MSPNDVQIAALGGTAAQYAALTSGKAAAVQLQSPILETAQSNHTVQTVYDFRVEQGLQASLVFTARTAAVRANPAPYQVFMRTYRQIMNRFRTDPAYAMKMATAEWGATTSAADLQSQLAAYLTNPGIWSPDCVYTVVLYTNTRQLLLDSGLFTADGFPTYRQLTQYAPPLGAPERAGLGTGPAVKPTVLDRMRPAALPAASGSPADRPGCGRPTPTPHRSTCSGSRSGYAGAASAGQAHQGHARGRRYLVPREPAGDRRHRGAERLRQDDAAQDDRRPAASVPRVGPDQPARSGRSAARILSSSPTRCCRGAAGGQIGVGRAAGPDSPG